ncbi:MAG: hypothetical protein D3923_08490 [Candidatus Electrothrix sp. AR3]|nr:hypothetical protein [Candidatus Electrothrix sp. AR3]
MEDAALCNPLTLKQQVFLFFLALRCQDWHASYSLKSSQHVSKTGSLFFEKSLKEPELSFYC